ncbi:aldehyde dehydrogenase family protein [Zavarzinia aquatilis]|uniref:Aldehyde dehydrogenase n=1 Tax=Zavarzinia aquatilis TaxID=2211142 RepID=A0A317DVY9_9PROT|nr:aldehyde dehydrogenase family protein [Zavarzinia aquatilis]PWR18130.1 aldehyde dehydrogenase [Zavarzinia aquatilis]
MLKTVSPVDGRVLVERPLATGARIETVLDAAHGAAPRWAATPLATRLRLVSALVDHLVAAGPQIAPEITWQMGRPISQTPGEVRGLEERARFMLGIAEEALAPVDPGPKPGFARAVKRVPLGVVAVVTPWNYPYLTAINAIVPALAAGNVVILKHSHQTPLVADRFQAAADATGLPPGVFQHLDLSHGDTAKLISDRRIAHVCFTGSVSGGHAVVRALDGGFATAGLELGGKDPAYVRADANLAHAIENIADGIFFNSGQSCCGIERVYVHDRLFDAFVEGVVAFARGYRLGDPTDPATNLGPMVRAGAADFVRAQVAEAVAQGARALVDPKGFAADKAGTPYLAPQVLVDVDHTMRVMTEETFGPVAGIMKVSSDEEAIALMNDSPYGLTAAIWTMDAGAAEAIGDRLETGTVFMNRCDYLDPALAWTGVKDTGRGATLSRVGYEHLTRPKSFHLRTAL